MPVGGGRTGDKMVIDFYTFFVQQLRDGDIEKNPAIIGREITWLNTQAFVLNKGGFPKVDMDEHHTLEKTRFGWSMLM